MKHKHIIDILILAALAAVIYGACWIGAETPTLPPLVSAEYIAPTPDPTPIPTPRPTPESTPIPTPEPNDQLDRRTVWMEGAEIDPAWKEQEGDCFSEIMARLLFQYDLTPEAACGIAANMWYESSFQPCVASVDGSYGLCQWVGDRKTRLYDWCYTNGYDGDTVEGQLAYMMYEMESYSVDLTGTAYECAANFCRVFESPPNAATQARMRGNYAEELMDRFFEDD